MGFGMEDGDDVIIIVGAGIAGLATSLGLHRLGIRSVVLECADSLRVEGFAFGMWTNAWRALDALGIGQLLRDKHTRITGISTTSVDSGLTTADLPYAALDPKGELEVRCVNRNLLLETMEKQLPRGTIRYSSKVVHIEQTQGCFNSIHLADGTILKSKVLIGCDGVNSVVARFLGLGKPCFEGRVAVRGLVHYEDGHSFEAKTMHFFGNGVRCGVAPCDDHTIYWFFSFLSSPQGKEIEEDPTKLKQFILSKLGKVPDRIRAVFEATQVTNMVCSPLRFRRPWELVWGNICKGNICVAGDALHPMTPDLAQGACASLEDSVILARVLGEALKEKASSNTNLEKEQEQERIQTGLKKYAQERRWRSIDLIITSYMMGFMMRSGPVMNFVRDKIMSKFAAGVWLKKASFDCGNLTVSS